MKRIGIVTITKNPNYGNALQMLAMQRALEKTGAEAETIINYDGSTLFNIKNTARYYLRSFKNTNIISAEKKRRRFLRYLKAHVSFSKAFFFKGQLHRFNADDYDCYIVGSDQVWNPFFGLATELEMLGFAPKHKRIAYAASFGVSSLSGLDADRLGRISESIKGFRAVSLREKAGIEIVKDISGVEAELCLDPTMLMSAEEWDSILERPRQKLPKRYIAVYMLGNITAEYEAELAELAREYEAEVINLMSDSFIFLNPSEFVWIIKNALFVCTDSFHASVFSIIYHRPFKIFTRIDTHKDQNSRFETLLEMCAITDTAAADWALVERQIAAAREKSMAFLKNAMS